tara:strand:+ start:16319 stop:17002 length:684 start_codon:yes stop_codon:yes gene_type:complete
MEKLNVIITGATGMVGKGVLLETLKDNTVKKVLVINRESVGIQHPKLKEIIHQDFFNLKEIENELIGYNACFFCLGISSFMMPEDKYTKITYNLTLNFAQTLHRVNNGKMTFNYVSGAGTDSSEQGKSMWARVKGKTENDILNLGFDGFYAFRPAYIKANKDAPTKTLVYKIPLYLTLVLHPVIAFLFPNFTTTTQSIAKAMIEVVINGFTKAQLESKDINLLASKL